MTKKPAIDPAIRRKVRQRLAEIERSHGVRVLFAVESGSRAWGFPSPDSDYDVRFVYQHPRDWYLSLIEQRDVIEVPIDPDGLDVSGWDLRKALRLFLKSNPPLYEWLVSPIVYRRNDKVMKTMRRLAVEGYSRRAMAWHYLRIAERAMAGYLRGRAEINLKKYFYAVRPAAALLWLTEYDALPPMRLQDMLAGIEASSTVRRAIDHLLALKTETSEIGGGKPIAALDSWLARSIARGRTYCESAPVAEHTATKVQNYFRRLVDDTRERNARYDDEPALATSS